MKNIKETKNEFGFSSNALKIIAIIFMIIDHFAYYFRYTMTDDTYYILRMLGRIAMPIFVYLIVQGYFHTKNIWRYIFNLLMLAVITQISLFIVGKINYKYFPNYSVGINNYLNILFSFVFSLLIIYLLDNKVVFLKARKILNYIIRILGVVIIIGIYFGIRIDYEYRIPFMVTGIYLIEKMYKKHENKVNEKYILYKIVYMICLIVLFYFSFYMQDSVLWFNILSFISIIPIMLYNGKRGKNNKVIKYSFYVIFPLQHIILYLLGMILKK